MKKLLPLLFGLLVLAGCKKDAAKPTPPAQAISGQYTMTSATSSFTNGQTVPLPFTFNGATISGTITVTQVAGQDNQVNMAYTIKVTGQADQTDNVNGVQVQPAASGYTLTYNGQAAGTADGTNLTLVDGNDRLTAKK